jgi:uncharacterized membrane protein (DUF2068 family)
LISVTLSEKIKRGLRAVALFEACKGVLVLFAGLAVFTLIHQNVQIVAEQLVGHLHLNPAKNIPKIFVESARNLTNGRIALLALCAMLYSAMRFVESYGLWFGKRWAEWFALLSGGVYLPLELYELAKGFTWLKIFFVMVNLIIVLYMVVMLRRKGKDNRIIGGVGALIVNDK